MAKYRAGRINEEMKKELSNIILHQLKDPRVTAMVSVTDVNVSSDLKYAKVYLSVFAVNKDEEKTSFEAIKKASGFIRTRLSRTLNLRNTPELTFIEDKTIDYGMHMDEVIRKVVTEKTDMEESPDEREKDE